MKTRFLLAGAYWALLSYLAVWVCDYDFLEAAYWEERPAAWRHYWLLCTASSLLFAFVMARNRHYWKALAATATVITVAAGGALAYGWFYSFAEVRGDWHFRLFYSTIYVSRTMRLSMNALVVLTAVQSAASYLWYRIQGKRLHGDAR